MTYIIPYNHKRDLRAALESAGWGIELVEPPAEAWWMHELWQVRSRFRPVGFETFVAFVGGPDGAGEPHPGASHITVGPIPTSWQNSANLPSFALSKNWQSEQKRLIDLLSKIRNSEIEPN
jgi:hypothetical protein